MKPVLIILIIATVIVTGGYLLLWQSDYFKNSQIDFISAGKDIPETPPVTTTNTDQQVYYTIKEGDTLWSIAKKHYGNGAKWELILEANKDTIGSKDAIQPGWKIILPPDKETIPQAIYHTVMKNDTLTRIAVKYYNDPKKIDLIFNANRDKLATKETSLQTGWKLKIPFYVE